MMPGSLTSRCSALGRRAQEEPLLERAVGDFDQRARRDVAQIAAHVGVDGNGEHDLSPKGWPLGLPVRPSTPCSTHSLDTRPIRNCRA